MIFHFMTKRNINGQRHFLEIDASKKTISIKCPHVTPWSNAVEIKLCDLNRLAFEAKESGYKYVD